MDYRKLAGIVALTLPSLGWLYLVGYQLDHNDAGSGILILITLPVAGFCLLTAIGLLGWSGAKAARTKLPARVTGVHVMILAAVIILLAAVPMFVRSCR
jgi:exosortase/archaeosortase